MRHRSTHCILTSSRSGIKQNRTFATTTATSANAAKIHYSSLCNNNKHHSSLQQALTTNGSGRKNLLIMNPSRWYSQQKNVENDDSASAVEEEPSLQFEKELKRSNDELKKKSSSDRNLLAELSQKLQQYAFGYFNRTLDILLQLHENQLPLSHEMASDILASLFRARRYDAVEYFFHQWFKNSIRPTPQLDRSWMKEFLDIQKNNLSNVSDDQQRTSEVQLAEMKRVLQNPGILLPQEQKFSQPSQFDYVTLLNSYADRADQVLFMEARAGFKRDMKQEEDSHDPDKIIASTMRLFRKKQQNDVVWNIFTSNFNSALQKNPGAPDARPRDYATLIGSEAAGGEYEKCKQIFKALKRDFGTLQGLDLLVPVTALIRSAARSHKTDDVWHLFETHFCTDPTDPKQKDKLYPDSAILTILLKFYTKKQDKERLVQLIQISHSFLELDRTRRMQIQQSNKWIAQKNSKTEEQPELTENGDVPHTKTYGPNQFAFKLDYLFSSSYFFACKALGKPEDALAHFKQAYKSSFREDNSDPLLLTPSLLLMGELMNLYASIPDVSTVEALYEAAHGLYPPSQVSKAIDLNHAVLLAYARAGKFDDMLKIFEERFYSSLSPASQKNFVRPKLSAIREILIILMTNKREIDMMDFMDLVIHDLPQVQPVALCRKLLPVALEKHLPVVPALFNYFTMQKPDHDLNVAYGSFLSLVHELYMDKQYTTIIDYYKQLPDDVKFDPRISCHALRTVLEHAGNCRPGWNEFLKFYSVPDSFEKFDQTRHPDLLEDFSVPEDKKAVPNENAIKFMLSALAKASMVNHVDQLLTYARRLPVDYADLYQFQILAEYYRTNDLAAAIEDMVRFYNTPHSKQGTEVDTPPPVRLYKELIYMAPDYLHAQVAVLSDMMRQQYPKALEKMETIVKSKRESGNPFNTIDSQVKSFPLIEKIDNNDLSASDMLSIYKKYCKEHSNPADGKEKKAYIEAIMHITRKYLDEGDSKQALRFMLVETNRYKLDRDFYMKFMYHIASCGDMDSLRKAIEMITSKGYTLQSFADPFVTGLLDAGLVREGHGFFSRLYDTPLNEKRQKRDMSKPPRRLYLLLTNKMQEAIQKGDQGLRPLLKHTYNAFSLQYPKKRNFK